jgi:hypothetical protein
VNPRLIENKLNVNITQRKIVETIQNTLDAWVEEHAQHRRADCVDVKRDYQQVTFQGEPSRFGLAFRGKLIRVSKVRINRAGHVRIGSRPR